MSTREGGFPKFDQFEQRTYMHHHNWCSIKLSDLKPVHNENRFYTKERSAAAAD